MNVKKLLSLLVFVACMGATGLSQSSSARLQDNGSIILEIDDSNEMVSSFSADLSPYQYNLDRDGDSFIQMFARDHITLTISTDRKSLIINLMMDDAVVNEWGMDEWKSYLSSRNN